MNEYRVLVADSVETSRKKLCGLIKKKGYKTYQATDGLGAIRLTRTVSPDLVIIDVNLWGMSAFEVGRIIEDNHLSTVIFITNKTDQNFYSVLKQMTIYAYILKPYQIEQLYNTIEFAIMNSNKINHLMKKVTKLENDMKNRKKIDKAKGILMSKLGIIENEAYNILRKRSMNECKAIYKVAEEIIEKYENRI